MNYLILDLVLMVILSIFILIFHKDLLNSFDELINNLRIFIYRNDSFFTILFLFIFFIQQLILILFGYIFREDIIRLQILISIFALIVVTTASLQKIVLDIKVRFFKEAKNKMEEQYYFSKEALDRLKSKKN